MPKKSTTTAEINIRHLQTVQEFSQLFDQHGAKKILHLMMRAALAQKPVLNKEGLQDLLYFKEEMTELIAAAGTLAKDKKAPEKLQQLFAKKPAAKWIASLDRFFRAAVFDGFFVVPPGDGDLYKTFRWFFKLLKLCYKICPRDQP